MSSVRLVCFGLFTLMTAAIFLLRANVAFADESVDALRHRIEVRVGGIPSLTTAELADRLAGEARQRPLLIDVRTRAEYDVSHLAGAVLAETEAEQRRLVKTAGSSRLVVLYCSVGWRSGMAVERLRAEGEARAFNLAGSIFQWVSEGRPVTNGEREVAVVHPFDDNWGRLIARRYWSRSAPASSEHP